MCYQPAFPIPTDKTKAKSSYTAPTRSNCMCTKQRGLEVLHFHGISSRDLKSKIIAFRSDSILRGMIFRAIKNVSLAFFKKNATQNCYKQRGQEWLHFQRISGRDRNKSASNTSRRLYCQRNDLQRNEKSVCSAVFEM